MGKDLQGKDQARGSESHSSKMSGVKEVHELSFPFKTLDPFLFCVYHKDAYPKGTIVLYWCSCSVCTTRMPTQKVPLCCIGVPVLCVLA